MKVGLFLTNQQQLGTDMVSALGDQIAMVHHARDRGWSSLFSGQHYLNEGDNKQLQIVPFIARLIPEAGEMTTGLGVLLLNLHNPVYVAETVATLDIIAGGNFVFGIGLGYRDVEFDAFDVPKGKRVARMVEYLDLVRPAVDGGLGDAPRRDVPARRRPDEHPSGPAAVAAGVDRRQQRPRNPARGAHRRHLDGQSALHHRHHPPPARALPRGARRGRASRSPASFRASRRSSARRTGRPRSRWRVPTCSRSTAPTRHGDRTRPCPTTNRSIRSSTTCSATASFSARPRSATSSSVPYFEELGVNHLIFRTPLGRDAAPYRAREHAAHIRRAAAGAREALTGMPEGPQLDNGRLPAGQASRECARRSAR